MRATPLRTISGRIVAGFLLLVFSFGGVAAFSIVNTYYYSHAIGSLRSTHMAIMPLVAVLQNMQGQIVDYLDEPNLSRVRIDRNRKARLDELAKIDATLASVTDIQANFQPKVRAMREKVAQLLADVAATEDLVAAAFGPDAKTNNALSRLKANEARLKNSVQAWQTGLQTDSLGIIANFSRQEWTWRVVGMALGGIAVLLMILVTVWLVVTLRPLGRLRDGARRVARGDYRGRVDASGGTEVADLATEFNAMAAAIEEREQELVRSERLAAVGKMAAVITHEVRNPLSSLGLNAELLGDELARIAAGGSPAEAQTLLAAMHKEVDRLTAITEEYLRFARLPRPKLAREQVNTIVSGLVEFQKEELGLRGVKVSARLDDTAPPVAADEGQLRQALLNLVRNAADAMTTGGELTVITGRDASGGVEVRVADTGPGISEEHLAKIFEPFFSTKDGGTGLGLALTQQIIAEHGGRIEVESTIGKGTTFVVRLPAAA